MDSDWEEPQAPVHEVETLTFEPPARTWADEAETRTAEVLPVPEQDPRIGDETAATEEVPSKTDDAPETGELLLDSEAAAAPEETPDEASETPASDAGQSADTQAADEPKIEIQPEVKRRRGRPPSKAKQAATEQAPEAKEEDAGAAKRKKTRAATTVRKTRQSRASSRAKITPKQPGEEA
jgi:hypothetical protein